MVLKFDVVVSGISGRFPECDDIDTFKKKLYEGNSNEFVTTNEKKWTHGFKKNRYGDKVSVPDATGKYTEEIEFDYRLFKFSSLFAQSTDVVNRKILEPSFEAIVDAGINPYSLDGANVGVFMMGGLPEREINASSAENTMKRSFVLGNARTMAPNRLSYALNLTGPSYALHADPLGGFAALKVAKELVSDGTVEAAVVAVASNLIDPTFSYLYMNLNLLTSDECCRSFDKSANGFVRSECSVVFFLQREQDAKRQYAKLLLCDDIFEGLSSHTLLGYDEKYLKNSLRKIYERNENAAVAEDIAFLELTGCAVERFESAEANAVADVLCKDRMTPLMVGSVKSNVGHTEVASGLLSVLKIILALDSRVIAPNANFSEVNEKIRAFHGKQMQVVDKKTELCGNIAAVNIVGLWGGVNHVILQNDVRQQKKNYDNIPRLLLLSGRTADGLRNVFEKIEMDGCNVEAIALANDAFETDMPFHIYRGFTILPKTGLPAVVEMRMKTQRPICFIFSGMGSQWNGMGKHLLDFPIIAEVIKRCDAVLRPKSIDIYDVLLSEDPTMFDDITMSFVAIICMQIALVEVLKKLNIVPDLMLGHSAGECGCAYADGCLSLEEAILVNYSRGIVSNSIVTIKGKMAAVGKGYQEMKDDIPGAIEVACHNAVNSCTLSGPADDIDEYVEKIKNRGIFARSVNVGNIAYHSRYIRPFAPKHFELLKKVITEPKKRSSKWISTSISESEWHLPAALQCSAEYFNNNLLNPVLFEEACKHIPEDAVCIEISPHGLLQAILKRSLPQTCTNISLTLRSETKENLNYLLSSIGKLYIAGCEPAVNKLYPPIEYPVSRGTPSISSYCSWFHGDRDAVAPHLNRAKPRPLSQEKIVIRINEDEEFNFLKYHQINESIIVPPSFLLYLVWRMLSIKQNVQMDEFPVLFENIKVHKNMKISISKLRSVSILIQGSGSFELLSRHKTSPTEKVIMTGIVEFIRTESEVLETDFDSVETIIYSLNADDINTILKNVGFRLGECFQLLTGVKVEDSEFQGTVEWRGNWITFLDSIMKFQMVSDFQKSKLCFLKSIRRMIIIPSAMKFQKLGEQVIAKYCRITKYFQCHGIAVYDAKWKTDNRFVSPKSTTSSFKIRKFKFVSFNNPSCQSPFAFIDISTQISLETLDVTANKNLKLYMCDYTRKFYKSIQKSEVIQDYGKGKVIFCNPDIPLLNQLSMNNSYLLIAEGRVPDNDLSCLESTHNVYIVIIASQNDFNHVPVEFITILEQRFDRKMFTLLKKKLNHIPTIRIDNNNKTTNYDLSTSLNNVSNVAVRPRMNSASLKLMLSRKENYGTRFVFTDNSNRLVTENDPAFQSMLLTGLPKIVKKNQDWGTYKYQSSSFVESYYDKSTLRHSLMNIQIESICVEFVRPGLSSISQLSNDLDVQPFGIEFSGLNATGQKLMGLAMIDQNKPITTLDPSLNWLVPEVWTMAEAATIPLMYAHVFSIIKKFENSLYMPSPKILINAGEDDMLNVELCVTVCLLKKFIVYVVVSNVEQTERLKQNCSLLEESCIILENDGRFNHEIMSKTNMDGVNVVINYKHGIESFTTTTNCVSTFAYYIETVQSNLNENNEIGMYTFLKALNFAVVPRNISYLLNQPADIKKQLHRAISDGIKSGLVRPIDELNMKDRSMRVNNHQEVSHGNNSKLTLTGNPGMTPDYIGFKHSHSHIILGSEHSEEAWINLIDWLTEKGGINFVVLVETLPAESQISNQLKCLLTNKKITVLLMPLDRLISNENAIQLIQNTNESAPVDSIFFVFFEVGSHPQTIDYMNMASQTVARNIKLISLNSDGLEVMELRQSRGVPGYVLHGEIYPQNVSKVMTKFEKMMSSYDWNDNQCVLYQVTDERKDSNLENELSSFKNFLPKNIASLERIGRCLSETVEFVEMTSRCPKLAHCRGVFPIFVIPSLHASELQSLLQSLMYPVFCASLTENCSSVNETAGKLFEHLKLIQPLGPVTLIAETWSSAVAGELSSIIKKSGRDFQTFLLQGNPIEWKETIQNLKLAYHEDLEIVFINIYGKTQTKYMFSSDETNADRNKSTLAQKKNAAFVRRCFNVLRRQFRNICDYNDNNAKLENTVLFSTSFPQNIVPILSSSCNIVYVKEDNYEQFVNSSIIRKTINKQAMFSWNV